MANYTVFRRVVLSCVGLGLVGLPVWSGAADAERGKKRPPVADFTNDARMDVLRWLVKLEPAFATFQKSFTYAQPMFIRHDAYSPRICVSVDLPFRTCTVLFQASAEFADDLSTASKSRIDFFNVIVPMDGRTYQMKLPPGEMKEFAADPEGYVAKKAGTAKTK